MNPTPTELARAAELEPRVAEIVPSLTVRKESGALAFAIPDLIVNRRWVHTILDPRAFQAVLLALPVKLGARVLSKVQHRAYAKAYAEYLKADGGDKDPEDRLWPFEAWLLTPAGMLAFYEALVAQEGGDGC